MKNKLNYGKSLGIALKKIIMFVQHTLNTVILKVLWSLIKDHTNTVQDYATVLDITNYTN